MHVQRVAIPTPQLRLSHAVPSLSVDHTHSPGQPRPLAPLPTAIRGRITATTGESASAPATVLSSSRILPLGVLPLASPHSSHLWMRFSSIVRAFTSSIREPGPGSCCLYAGHHLGSTRRVEPAPVLMSSEWVSTRQRQRTLVHRSSSRSTPDAVLCRAFSDDVQDHGLQPRPLAAV